MGSWEAELAGKDRPWRASGALRRSPSGLHEAGGHGVSGGRANPPVLPQEIGPVESPKPQSSDEARSDLLAHTPSSSTGHGQPPAEHLEESERVRAAVRSLKGERRALRAQLQDREYVTGAAASRPGAPLPPTCVSVRRPPSTVHRPRGLGRAQLTGATARVLVRGSRAYVSVMT